MKNNKTSIYIVILIFLSPVFLSADAGSWSKSFSLKGGSLYAETEHPIITLEKELLVFDGETTTAYFLFVNTADRPVRVTCGFPVRVTINTYEAGDGVRIIQQGKYSGRAGPIMGLEFLQTEVPEEEFSGQFELDAPTYIPMNSYNNSREFLPRHRRPEGIEFIITQNGREIPVNQLLVERHASEDGVWITFHYKHNLQFSPGERSVVKVHYRYDMISGVRGGASVTDYRWNYIIGTGSTWKGPIGDFYFLRTGKWSGEKPEELYSLYSSEYLKLYHKEDYEPAANAIFSLSHQGDTRYQYFRDFEQLKQKNLMNPVRISKSHCKPQSFIRNISASSNLADRVSVYTPEGILINAPFTAGSLFDGIRETAWCEGVVGPGIGEYVSFTLSKKIWGMTLQNGFNRMVLPDAFYNDYYWENTYRNANRGILDYYTLNNRPKRLNIEDSDGNTLYRLSIRDTREWQTFPGVKLEPGTYRLVIKDVYYGSLWQDTCIGEVKFLIHEDSGAMELQSFRQMLDDQQVLAWIEEVSF